LTLNEANISAVIYPFGEDSKNGFAWGILLSGGKDDEAHNYLIDSAFPIPMVFDLLAQARIWQPEMTIFEILSPVNW
jgi:hypothetical protein